MGGRTDMGLLSIRLVSDVEDVCKRGIPHGIFDLDNGVYDIVVRNENGEVVNKIEDVYRENIARKLLRFPAEEGHEFFVQKLSSQGYTLQGSLTD